MARPLRKTDRGYMDQAPPHSDAVVSLWGHTYAELRAEAERILLASKRGHRRHIGKHGFTQAKADRQTSLQVAIVLVLRELEKCELLV